MKYITTERHVFVGFVGTGRPLHTRLKSRLRGVGLGGEVVDLITISVVLQSLVVTHFLHSFHLYFMHTHKKIKYVSLTPIYGCVWGGEVGV